MPLFFTILYMKEYTMKSMTLRTITTIAASLLGAALLSFSTVSKAADINPWNDYLKRNWGGVENYDLLNGAEMALAADNFYLTDSSSCDRANMCHYLVYSINKKGLYEYVGTADYPRLANYPNDTVRLTMPERSYSGEFQKNLKDITLLRIINTSYGILIPRQYTMVVNDGECQVFNSAPSHGYLPMVKGNFWDLAVINTCQIKKVQLLDNITHQGWTWDFTK